ncbi:MAG: P-loop NTPase [Fibrobacterota bacterium]
MKEILIISGKGGTGKTSVTAGLACISRAQAVADCDVDAANLHLVLRGQQAEGGAFYGGHEAVIDQDRCFSCFKCQSLCRFDAISEKALAFSVDPVACEGCGVCVAFCPAEAIDFPRALSGEWYLSNTAFGIMAHARLTPGAENSGKLVTKVRETARAAAKKRQAPFILIDGPPGVGCPVISSVTGVDLAVVVTEPTLSGIHDMKRALSLARHFGVAPAVVINRWDINEEQSGRIEAFCKDNAIPLLGKIAYTPEFVRAQKAGISIPEYAPDSAAAEKMKEIWNSIQENLTL